MAIQDVVNQGVLDLQAAESQAQSDFLTSFYGKVQADLPAASGGGVDQSVVDGLKAQISALQAQVAGDAGVLSASQAADAQALADVQTKAASDLAAVQASLDAMTAKEQLEEAAVSDVAAKVASAQQSLADMTAAFQKIMGAFAPPAAPVDAPVSGS